MRLLLAAGSTATARVDGISAAGADRDAMLHTPAADLEIVAYGRPVLAPVVPVSPTGTPTPAVITRAARELLGIETLAVDAGIARPTGAPTVRVGGEPGGDIREARPVGNVRDLFTAGRQLGGALPDEELAVGETVPGGTTTAMGVLAALGERTGVSSSLSENPLELKERVVGEALAASDLSEGDAAGDPLLAIECAGDPVLASVAGVIAGATDAGKRVTLAGGTQMAAAGALARHAGIEAEFSLATTSFLADDNNAAIQALAADLDLDLIVTDPGFDRASHPAMDGYVAGEAKEGVGMGGVLALLAASNVPMAELRERVVAVYDRLERAEK